MAPNDRVRRADRHCPAGSAEPEQDAQLAAQVGNLATEVEMMREDQAQRRSRGVPSAEPPAATEEKPPTTLFVYRDGHQMEVQNYAILGNTLWVFSDQRNAARSRSPISTSRATKRVNEERGVDFAAPDPQ